MTVQDVPPSLSIIAERHLARARAALEERGVDTADMPVAEIFDRSRGDREPAKPQLATGTPCPLGPRLATRLAAEPVEEPEAYARAGLNRSQLIQSPAHGFLAGRTPDSDHSRELRRVARIDRPCAPGKAIGKLAGALFPRRRPQNKRG